MLCACGHALTIHDTAGVCHASIPQSNGMVPCGCHDPRPQEPADSRSVLAADVALSATPNERELIEALVDEMHRQDVKHGPFAGSRLGRARLALACLEDEVAEAKQAWRDERKATAWHDARAEVLQVAAVAMRALRDAFTDEEWRVATGSMERTDDALRRLADSNHV